MRAQTLMFKTTYMVAGERFELSRSFDHWFLRPARLPISPSGHIWYPREDLNLHGLSTIGF